MIGRERIEAALPKARAFLRCIPTHSCYAECDAASALLIMMVEKTSALINRPTVARRTYEDALCDAIEDEELLSTLRS